MSDILLSVIVPCRDRAGLLARLLDSVAAQVSAPSFEVIVVDDGSRDDSAAVAEAHPAKVRCVRLTPSQGPGRTRNQGATLARGQYLMFLDSDDVLPTWGLATCAATLAGHPEAELVLLTEQAIDPDAGACTLTWSTLHANGYLSYAHAAGSGHEFGGGKCIVKRTVFEASEGFATDVRICEDQDLGFRLSAAGPCVVVTAPVCIGRGSGHAKLMDDHRAWLDGMQYLMIRERDGCYPGSDEMRQLRARLMSRSFRSLSVALVREGALREAARAYALALALHMRARAWRFVFMFPPWAVLSLSKLMLTRSWR